MCIIPSIGQEKSSPREMFLEAESYFLYEEYSEALPIYIKLSLTYPQNDNINYRIGRCFLNIPYEKHKSIEYLEKAIKNINPNYKEGSLKETKAPIDAHFYLGDAYRINNQLDKAITTYKYFKSICDSKIYDHLIIDDQIRSCENARKLEKSPVVVEYDNLGNTINSRSSETNPVLSGDESIIVYNTQLPFYTAVYFSQKVNGKWETPVNINPDLGVDEDCSPVCLSYDGKELILYRNNEFLGDLYVSHFANGKWSKIKRLNGNINTRYWESHASLSKDGKKLYFTSNRKDSYGGLDIYVSTRKEKDNWELPVNIGSTVNSPLNEETPFISADGQKLFFSSFGHNGIGGYDIFVSELKNDGSWSEPQNLGYPMNTTDNDLFFQPVGNGNNGYISRFTNTSFGRSDIYMVTITSKPAQLAAVNQTLEKPVINTPSSDEVRSIVKTNAEPKTEKLLLASNNQEDRTTDIQDPKPQDNELNDKQNEQSKADSAIETSIDASSEIIQSAVTKTTLNENKLSPGQKQAWHKMLYGGIGILAVFILFILFLLFKSRKRKNKPSEQKL